MKIKSSAGLLAGGLATMIAGGLLALVRTTDEFGNSQFPLWFFGLVASAFGLVLLIWGVYQFARNIDLAAAKYVDGDEAVELLAMSRTERIKES